MRAPSRLAAFVPLTLSIALAGCLGGGSSSDSSSSSSSTQAGFPAGLAVSSPTDLNSSAALTSVVAVPFTTRVADFGRAFGDAWAKRDYTAMRGLLAAGVPMGEAHAAPLMTPAYFRFTAILDGIMAGTLNPVPYMDWGKFVETATNDNCYGPQIAYQDHDDAGGGAAAGTLPTGDLGMWQATSAGDGRPCSVAQLSKRMRSTSQKTNQALIMMAAMVDAAKKAGLTLPSAGGTLSVQSQMNTIVHSMSGMPGTVTVSAASITLDSGGTVWTYRVRAADSASNKTLEIILNHTTGSGSGDYSGNLSFILQDSSVDAAMSCTDETVSPGIYKTSHVGTVRYQRNALVGVRYSAREANYCGWGSNASTSLAADVATFDSNNELDPTVKLAGVVRGGVKGWRANFNRMGATHSNVTLGGNFVYAWQAGTGDSHSRMFAVTMDYNAVTEARTAKAAFGYAAGIDTTAGAMLGMICNWAGPGNAHTPNDRFQYQAMSLASGAAAWTLDTSKITYAPTNACNSSATMEYDVNADAVLAVAEGNNVTNDLDSKGVSASVAAALVARGFNIPSWF